jgi:predicted Zn-ribbon and HTH transcriptional regulator
MIQVDRCENCGVEYDPHIYYDGECPECGGALIPIFEEEMEDVED